MCRSKSRAPTPTLTPTHSSLRVPNLTWVHLKSPLRCVSSCRGQCPGARVVVSLGSTSQIVPWSKHCKPIRNFYRWGQHYCLWEPLRGRWVGVGGEGRIEVSTGGVWCECGSFCFDHHRGVQDGRTKIGRGKRECSRERVCTENQNPLRFKTFRGAVKKWRYGRVLAEIILIL